MNWTRIFSNLVGVAAACVALERSGLTGEPFSWQALGGAILMCVVANQLGLHQEKP